MKFNKKSKGQGAIADALFFLMICAAASTLLFHMAGLYGSSTNEQILSIYNYEYAGNTLISLHYAKDSDGNWFWIELKNELEKDIDDALDYLEDNAQIWNKIQSSSPTSLIYLCFHRNENQVGCYPEDPSSLNLRAYTASIRMDEKWTAVIKLYY